MRYISLFSGIEAASVAWEPLGWEPVSFAEIEPFCCELLKQRFPEVPNLGDVTKIDWKKVINELGAIDVVVGGSPCQSFSIAGKREGLAGQSGLMFEYIRAVREIMPRFFVWENVPGALSVEGGRAFAQLLKEMDEIGYGLAWRVLDAQFFGVAQRRERLFLVGSFGSMACAEILFDNEGLSGNPQPSRKKRAELTADSQTGADGVHDYTLKLRHTGTPNRGGGSGPLVQTDISATIATSPDQTLFQSSLTPWDGQAVRVYNPYSPDCPPTLQASAADMARCVLPNVCWMMVFDGVPLSAADATTYEPAEVANTLNVFDVGEARANEIVCMTDTQPNTTLGTGGGVLGALTQRMFKDPPVVCQATEPMCAGRSAPQMVSRGLQDNPSTRARLSARSTFDPCFCLQNSYLDGHFVKGQGTGVNENVAYTCTSQGPHGVVYHERGGVVLIDRAMFNQGVNAQYKPFIGYADTSPTVVAQGPHAVMYEVGGGCSRTLREPSTPGMRTECQTRWSERVR